MDALLRECNYNMLVPKWLECEFGDKLLHIIQEPIPKSSRGVVDWDKIKQEVITDIWEDICDIIQTINKKISINFDLLFEIFDNEDLMDHIEYNLFHGCIYRKSKSFSDIISIGGDEHFGCECYDNILNDIWYSVINHYRI